MQNPYKDANIFQDDVHLVGMDGQEPMLMASSEREECAQALGGTFRTDFYRDRNGDEYFYDNASGLSEEEWLEEQRSFGIELTRAGINERPSNYIYTHKRYDLGDGGDLVSVREDEEEAFRAEAQKQGWSPTEVLAKRWNGVDVSGKAEALANLQTRFSEDGQFSDDVMMAFGASEADVVNGKLYMQGRVEKIDESIRKQGEMGFAEYEAKMRGVSSIGREAKDAADWVHMYATEAADAVTIDTYWTLGEMAEQLGGDDGLEKIRNLGFWGRTRAALWGGLSIEEAATMSDEDLHNYLKEIKSDQELMKRITELRGLTFGAKVGSGAIDMGKLAVEMAATTALAAAMIAATGGAATALSAGVLGGAISAAGGFADEYGRQTADRMYFNPVTGRIEKVADGRSGGEAAAYTLATRLTDYAIERVGGKLVGKLANVAMRPIKRVAQNVLGKEMATVLGLTPGVVANWAGGGVLKQTAMKMSRAYHQLAHNSWGRVVQSGIAGITPSGVLEELSEELVQAGISEGFNLRGELDLEKGKIAEASWRAAGTGMLEVLKSAPEFAATLALYNVGAGPLTRGTRALVDAYGSRATLSKALQWSGKYTAEEVRGMSRDQIKQAFADTYMRGSPEGGARAKAQFLRDHETASGAIAALQNRGFDGYTVAQNDDGEYTVTTQDGNVISGDNAICEWAADIVGEHVAQFGERVLLANSQAEKVSRAIMFISRKDIEGVIRQLRETGASRAFEVFGNSAEMVDAMQQAMALRQLSESQDYAGLPSGYLMRQQSDAIIESVLGDRFRSDEEIAAMGEFSRYLAGIDIESANALSGDMKPVFSEEELKAGGTAGDGGSRFWEKNGIRLMRVTRGEGESASEVWKVRMENPGAKTFTRTFGNREEALSYVNGLEAKRKADEARYVQFKHQAEQVYDNLFNNKDGGSGRSMIVLRNAWENDVVRDQIVQSLRKDGISGAALYRELQAIPGVTLPDGTFVVFTDNCQSLTMLTSTIRHEGLHSGVSALYDLADEKGRKAFIERASRIFVGGDGNGAYALRDAMGETVSVEQFSKMGESEQQKVLEETCAYLCEVMEAKPGLAPRIADAVSALFGGAVNWSGLTSAQRVREARILISQAFARVHSPERIAAAEAIRQMTRRVRRSGPPKMLTYAISEEDVFRTLHRRGVEQAEEETKQEARAKAEAAEKEKRDKAEAAEMEARAKAEIARREAFTQMAKDYIRWVFNRLNNSSIQDSKFEYEERLRREAELEKQQEKDTRREAWLEEQRKHREAAQAKKDRRQARAEYKEALKRDWAAYKEEQRTRKRPFKRKFLQVWDAERQEIGEAEKRAQMDAMWEAHEAQNAAPEFDMGEAEEDAYYASRNAAARRNPVKPTRSADYKKRLGEMVKTEPTDAAVAVIAEGIEDSVKAIKTLKSSNVISPLTVEALDKLEALSEALKDTQELAKLDACYDIVIDEIRQIENETIGKDGRAVVEGVTEELVAAIASLGDIGKEIVDNSASPVANVLNVAIEKFGGYAESVRAEELDAVLGALTGTGQVARDFAAQTVTEGVGNAAAGRISKLIEMLDAYVAQQRRQLIEEARSGEERFAGKMQSSIEAERERAEREARAKENVKTDAEQAPVEETPVEEKSTEVQEEVKTEDEPTVDEQQEEVTEEAIEKEVEIVSSEALGNAAKDASDRVRDAIEKARSAKEKWDAIKVVKKSHNKTPKKTIGRLNKDETFRAMISLNMINKEAVQLISNEEYGKLLEKSGKQMSFHDDVAALLEEWYDWGWYNDNYVFEPPSSWEYDESNAATWRKNSVKVFRENIKKATELRHFSKGGVALKDAEFSNKEILAARNSRRGEFEFVSALGVQLPGLTTEQTKKLAEVLIPNFYAGESTSQEYDAIRQAKTRNTNAKIQKYKLLKLVADAIGLGPKVDPDPVKSALFVSFRETAKANIEHSGGKQGMMSKPAVDAYTAFVNSLSEAEREIFESSHGFTPPQKSGGKGRYSSEDGDAERVLQRIEIANAPLYEVEGKKNFKKIIQMRFIGELVESFNRLLDSHMGLACELQNGFSKLANVLLDSRGNAGTNDPSMVSFVDSSIVYSERNKPSSIDSTGDSSIDDAQTFDTETGRGVMRKFITPPVARAVDAYNKNTFYTDNLAIAEDIVKKNGGVPAYWRNEWLRKTILETTGWQIYRGDGEWRAWYDDPLERRFVSGVARALGLSDLLDSFVEANVADRKALVDKVSSKIPYSQKKKEVVEFLDWQSDLNVAFANTAIEMQRRRGKLVTLGELGDGEIAKIFPNLRNAKVRLFAKHGGVDGVVDEGGFNPLTKTISINILYATIAGPSYTHESTHLFQFADGKKVAQGSNPELAMSDIKRRIKEERANGSNRTFLWVQNWMRRNGKKTFTEYDAYHASPGEVLARAAAKVALLKSDYNRKHSLIDDVMDVKPEDIAPTDKDYAFRVQRMLNGGTVRFKVSRANDEAYLRAVNSGDKDTAMLLLRKAAAQAMPNTLVLDDDGLPLVVYHGSKAKGFTAFSKDKMRSGGAKKNKGVNLYGDGFYFAKDYYTAQQYGKNVYPYFLNIANPAPNDLRLETGNDGIIGSVPGSKIYVTFNPNQIKSADLITYDDNGNVIPLSERFNPDVDDVRFKVVHSGGDGFDFFRRAKISSDSLRRSGEFISDKLVNDQGPLFRAIKRVLGGKAVEDEANVEAAAKNVHGKIRNEAERVHNKFIKPLFALIKKHNLDAEQLDEYLYAHFAKERNRMIRERTAVVDPETGELREIVDDGSGMTDQEAEAILAKFATDPKRRAYDAAMHYVWHMNADSAQKEVRYGLITEEQRRTWAKKSPHYVPLKDLMTDKFSVRRATGRYSRAASPLAASIWQAESIIRTGELANVNKTLAAFIKKYDPEGTKMGGRVMDVSGERKVVVKGDPVFVPYGSEAERELTKLGVTLVETPESAAIGGRMVGTETLNDKQIPNTLRVKTLRTTSAAPNAVSYWSNGARKFIVFDKDNAEAMKVAAAANHAGLMRPGADSSTKKAWDLAQRVLRWKADVSTTLNPRFILRNMGSDFFNTSLILATEGKYRELGGFVKNYIGAMAAVRALAKGKDISKTKLGRYYLEAREQGMLTGVFGEGSFKDAAHKLERDIKRLKGSVIGNTCEAFKDFMETVGSYPEQGARLAVYAAMRDRGMSPAQAAQYGREVSVDFNAKGEWTPVVNALYMFSNAGAQGIARAIKALATGAEARGGGLQGYARAAMPGVSVCIILGYLSAALMDAAGGGDEDDEEGGVGSAFDRLPEHVKAQNINIPLGGDAYLQMPTRGMFQPFVNLGQLLYSAQTGKADGADVAAGFATSIADATDFIGGQSPTLAQWLSPTIFDPAVQVLEGKDWTGRDLYQRDYGQAQAESHRGRTGTEDLYQMAAKWLNTITGGNSVEGGAIDLYPETLKVFTEFFAGSLATMAADVGETVGAFGGGDFNIKHIPVGGGVLRQAPGREAQYYTAYSKFIEVSKKYDSYLKAARTLREADAREEMRKNAERLLKENPWLASRKALLKMGKTIGDLRASLPQTDSESKRGAIKKDIRNKERYFIKRLSD